MNVYVESNFCLELAFEQEQAAEVADLLRLAEEGRIALAFPEFAICEPFSTLNRYENQRTAFVNELNKQLSELSRSAPTQALAAGIRPLVATLTGIGQQQATRLADVVERMLTCGRSIPLTAALVRRARQLEAQFDLSPQDGIVAACVLGDLQPLGAAADSHLFISRNSKDFDLMRPEFEAIGCKYLSSFRNGLQWVGAKI